MGLPSLDVHFYIPEINNKSSISNLEELLQSEEAIVPLENGSSDYKLSVYKPDYKKTKLTTRNLIEALLTTDGPARIKGEAAALRYQRAADIKGCARISKSWNRVHFKSLHNTDAELEENAIAVADTVKTIYDILDPLFVWGYMPSTIDAWDPELETTVQRLEDGYVDALGWLTIFPPAAVDRYGREKLWKAPAWRIREFSDGAMILITNPTPADSCAVEETAHEIANHLDMDIDPMGLPGE